MLREKCVLFKEIAVAETGKGREVKTWGKQGEKAKQRNGNQCQYVLSCHTLVDGECSL